MKNVKVLKTLVMSAVVTAILTGCSTSNKTLTTPNAKIQNQVTVVSDNDSSGLGIVMADRMLRTNFKYSFAMAASITKKKGFDYFSFVAPMGAMEQFKKHKVTDYNSAWEACTVPVKGRLYTFGDQILNIGTTLANASLKEYKTPNCGKLKDGAYSETTWRGTTLHVPVKFTFTMHNEDRKDNVTFNADEVLSAKAIKELDKKLYEAK